MMIFNLARVRAKLAFTAKYRAEFYGLLESFVDDGVPLFSAIEEIHNHYCDIKDPRSYITHKLLADSRGASGNVRRMSESLDWCISGAERLALDAGEHAGTIPLGLRTAAAVALKNAALVQSIQSNLSAPTFLMAGIVALLFFIRSQTIPLFTQVLPRERWPLVPSILGKITDFVPIGIPVTIAVALVYLAFFKISAENWTPGPLRNKVDKHIFPFTVYSNANLAITLAGISALVNAKVSFGTAIERLRDCSTPWLYEHLESVLLLLREGGKEGDALATLYQGEAKWLISAYGKRSNFAEALLKLSDRINNELLAKISRQFKLIAFALSAFAATILTLVLLSSGQIGISIRN
ncbi:type II secretion system F family protein [Delftia sp. GW456-R20]|uniref:type II secretion system F family protein n=1 Tax=Delftia sp. GW456-R20 TaxID=1827145 RepID=UPI0009EE4688|nr:type II secretion system F family protein [Delftia sp. GW456-R20]